MANAYDLVINLFFSRYWFCNIGPEGIFFSPYVSVNAYFQTRYMFEIIAAMFRLVKVELFLVFLLQELFGRIVDLW